MFGNLVQNTPGVKTQNESEILIILNLLLYLEIDNALFHKILISQTIKAKIYNEIVNLR